MAVTENFACERALARAALRRVTERRRPARLAQDALLRSEHVGAPHDKANAEYVRDLFKQWGWDARIEEFAVLYPKEYKLEMVAPSHFVASLTEPPIEGDRTSGRNDAPYNEYGADGDATGELVYLNYGMPEDYQALAGAAST